MVFDYSTAGLSFGSVYVQKFPKWKAKVQIFLMTNKIEVANSNIKFLEKRKTETSNA